ncbi:DUF3265 domain-containing protein [Vibrio diabolicus]|nr:DUF3265 domain-containing protein [Vibrio diabolicus]
MAFLVYIDIGVEVPCRSLIVACFTP